MLHNSSSLMLGNTNSSPDLLPLTNLDSGQHQQQQLTSSSNNSFGSLMSAVDNSSSQQNTNILNITQIPNLTSPQTISSQTQQDSRLQQLHSSTNNNNSSSTGLNNSKNYTLNASIDFSIQELPPNLTNSSNSVQTMQSMSSLANSSSSSKGGRDLINEILAGMNEDKERELADTTTPTSSTPTPTSRPPSAVDKKCNSIKGEHYN